MAILEELLSSLTFTENLRNDIDSIVIDVQSLSWNNSREEEKRFKVSLDQHSIT